MTSGKEVGSQVPSDERLNPQEVDQQAFDLIGKFKFVLEGSKSYQRALNDSHFGRQGQHADASISFQVRNDVYEVGHRMGGSVQQLKIERYYGKTKTGGLKQELVSLRSKGNKDSNGYKPHVKYSSSIGLPVLDNSTLAIGKAREMLRRLSSQK